MFRVFKSLRVNNYGYLVLFVHGLFFCLSTRASFWLVFCLAVLFERFISVSLSIVNKLSVTCCRRVVCACECLFSALPVRPAAEEQVVTEE